jgi:hypothetical protein
LPERRARLYREPEDLAARRVDLEEDAARHGGGLNRRTRAANGARLDHPLPSGLTTPTPPPRRPPSTRCRCPSSHPPR